MLIFTLLCESLQQSKEEKVPVVSVNRVRVEENSGVVITNSSLNVLDQDTPDNDIIITVTKQPTYGTDTHA